MRKLTVTFMTIVFMALAACAWIETNQETSEAVAKISARRIGAELQYKYPKIAKEVGKVCMAVTMNLKQHNDEALKEYIIEILNQEIDDNLLVLDIIDLIDLIKIEPNIELTADQLELISVITQSLMNGIELAGGHYGPER